MEKGVLKIGDEVVMLNNHSLYRESAYFGYTGKVTDIWEDGSFSISNGRSHLVCPMTCHYGKKKGYKLIVNGERVFQPNLSLKNKREVRKQKSFYERVLDLIIFVLLVTLAVVVCIIVIK